MDTVHNPIDAPSASPWVTRREAWALFGVTRMVWRRWERDGLVRGTHVDGRTRFDRATLLGLLAENGRLAPPYPDPDRPGCYRVPLCGTGMRRHEALIDADDLPIVEGRRWVWSISGGPRGGGAGHVALSHATHPVALRRLIMGVTDFLLHVSHVNGDPLDCRRANLLVRTAAEQVQATRKPGSVNGRAYTSRFKGVSWCKQTGRWRAQLRKGNRPHNIGRFDDEVTAAEAYDAAAREVFGDHAWLNFRDGVNASPQPDDVAASQAIGARAAA